MQPSPSSSGATAPSAAAVTSFAAIQRAQEADGAPRKKAPQRSLVEIQEEERARQVEQDFLRWWAAEEERLRAEEAATAALLASASGAGEGQHRKPRKTGKKGKPQGGEQPQQAQQQQQPQQQSQQPKSPSKPPHEKAGAQEGAQGQGQGQGGKPRKRRPPPAHEKTARDDARRLEAQS